MEREEYYAREEGREENRVIDHVNRVFTILAETASSGVRTWQIHFLPPSPLQGGP